MQRPSHPELTQPRREFLGRTLRGAALAAIAATGAVLGARAVHDPGACVKANPCQDCGAFSGCGLPKARTARNSAA